MAARAKPADTIIGMYEPGMEAAWIDQKGKVEKRHQKT